MSYVLDSLKNEAAASLQPTADQITAHAEQMLATKHQEASQAVTDLQNQLGQAQNDLVQFEEAATELAVSKQPPVAEDVSNG